MHNSHHKEIPREIKTHQRKEYRQVAIGDRINRVNKREKKFISYSVFFFFSAKISIIYKKKYQRYS